MQVAQECTFESETYDDQLTHRPVKRITSTDYWSHHQYFYFNMWTPDSRRVVISSNREAQICRPYLVDVEPEVSSAFSILTSTDLGPRPSPKGPPLANTFPPLPSLETITFQ